MRSARNRAVDENVNAWENVRTNGTQTDGRENAFSTFGTIADRNLDYDTVNKNGFSPSAESCPEGAVTSTRILPQPLVSNGGRKSLSQVKGPLNQVGSGREIAAIGTVRSRTFGPLAITLAEVRRPLRAILHRQNRDRPERGPRTDRRHRSRPERARRHARVRRPDCEYADGIRG